MKYNKNYIYKYLKKIIRSVQHSGVLTTCVKVCYFAMRASARAFMAKVTPRSISLLRKLSLDHRKSHSIAQRLIGNLFENECSLKGQYAVLAGSKFDFSRQQVVLVAHWDPENLVDPYVKHLCRHFKEIGKMVVLCSAGHLSVEESCDDWVDAIVCRKCPGYDFISWKAAMEAFPSLYSADELTLCNDSVFAPIGSYAPVYEAMKSISCDFWGMVASKEIMPHLQSYHLVFNKKALLHKAVRQFFSAIPADPDRNKAIAFELRLGLWLELNGLRPGAFASFLLFDYGNPSIYLWKLVISMGCPFFKREHLNRGGG